MKKIYIVALILTIFSCKVYAVDKYSAEYLSNKKHATIMTPFAEKIAESSLKRILHKKTNGKYTVSLDGYTASSIRKGIFKYVEINAQDLDVKGIKIPYYSVKSLDEYNYIDYRQKPIAFKSDMNFEYQLILNDETINSALKNNEYQKVLDKINKIAYPMFAVKSVNTHIQENEIIVKTEYNIPLMPYKRNKVFTTSSNFMIEDGKIKASDVKISSSYGEIAIYKVANMLNLLNPLEFTMNLLTSNKYKTNVENVKINNNKIEINGKMFVKGD